MDGRAGPSGRTYSAFLSYSSPDRAFTERFQRRIETYRFPTHIVRRIGDKRLKRVFRDRSEMVASPDLSQSIRDALDESDCLVVICSPASARSVWVGYEIKYFRETRENPCILAALISGDEKISFPPELLASGDGAWPLAADFRPEGDGDRMAFLKLVAAMGGIGLDDLIRRDTQRRIRRIQYGAAAMVAAAGTTAGVAVVTLQARATAAEERARSAQAAQFQLGYLRKKVEEAGRLDLLEVVNTGVGQYFKGRSLESMPLEERFQLSQHYYQEGDVFEQLGKLTDARTSFFKAYAVTASILKQRPDDPKAIFAQAQSDFYVGMIAWRMRDLRQAKAAFNNYERRAVQLVGIDPANLDWRKEKAFAESNLGMLLLKETSDLGGARLRFTKAQRDLEFISARRPADDDLRYDVADGHSYLADIERIGGNYDAALSHRVSQQTILQQLLQRNPRNAKYKAGMLVAKMGMARVTGDRGSLAAAAAQLAGAHDLATEFARSDPDNIHIARQTRAIELFQARNWLSMPAQIRPARATIEAAIGDCRAEWESSENQELAALCSLQEAKFARARNDRNEADRILRSPRLRETIITNRVSERWRVDLAKEYATLTNNMS